MFGINFGNNASSGSTVFEFGNALSFDGVNDYLSFTSLIQTTKFTLSYWFNQVNTNSVQSHFGKSADNNEFIGTLNNTVIRYLMAGGQLDFTVPTMSNNTWYNVVITRDSSNDLRLYLNGVESSAGAINRVAPLDIDQAGRYGSGAVQFNGKLDQIVVWNNVTATSSNAVSIYNAGSGVDPTTVIPSPNRLYNLNESGSTATANDEGFDNKDASLNNFTLPGAWVTH